jgi:hypothetical protein
MVHVHATSGSIKSDRQMNRPTDIVHSYCPSMGTIEDYLTKLSIYVRLQDF